MYFIKLTFLAMLFIFYVAFGFPVLSDRVLSKSPQSYEICVCFGHLLLPDVYTKTLPLTIPFALNSASEITTAASAFLLFLQTKKTLIQSF